MLHTKSNLDNLGCVPVSSNCVVWQGPDIECINLCAGDTVSSVVYKLALELCALKQVLTLTDLDLKCIVSACLDCPAPEKTLGVVLQLLINKVCTLEELIGTLGTGGTIAEAALTIATCFVQNDSNGDPVNSLPHSEYTRRIGVQVCSLLSTVNGHTTTLNNYGPRILYLENNMPAAYVAPKVVPNCVLPSVETEVNQLVDELEKQFCELKATLGTNQVLLGGAAQQCPALGASPALGRTGLMSSITGWNSTVTTIGQSLQNLWITVCDMRAAMATLKDCCGQTDCSEFILGFTAAASEDRLSVTLCFIGNTVIPSGFIDCSLQGAKITITDSAGHSHVSYTNLVLAAADTECIQVSLSSTTINPALNYTVTVEGCLTKDGKTCSKTHSEIVTVPCAIVTGLTASIS